MYTTKEPGMSDVSVYYSYDGCLCCADCNLSPVDGYMDFWSTEEMISHLRAHQELGDTIPDNLMDEIAGDDTQNFGSAEIEDEEEDGDIEDWDDDWPLDSWGYYDGEEW